ncbi:lebercilin-like protein isoform X1 [Acanthaster planci]|uniref:Lebercilin-like protein isoform X1 n=1 Tax=Acanthaster planci TaxID=133434 RepID=A0A8B7XPW3_ACAPL|nr:lebercilin-like protein isoform X1 [Acanthaster planci]XP_022082036.1 lebercilin-like protein isoform X1 [Acanthaster planci]
MTAVYDNDSFFDSDGEHDSRKADSPYLKGAYDRGSSPPTEVGTQRGAKNKSLTPSTSGNFSAKSSDSIMSEKSGAKSHRYGHSPSPPRSPSPYRSPYTQSPAYSDSFNSEDSEQDSRNASPERARQVSSKKPQHTGRARGGYSSTSSNRFNSGTSQDSRATYKSSNYGKTINRTKKAFQKTPLKKSVAAANTKRSNSIASSQASPRNTNEVTRRMLSAKGHTISRLRNEFNQLQKEHDETVRENKLLKELQRRQERALAKFDSEESELPQLLKKHSAELDSMRRRIRKYQERDRDRERRLKDKDEQYLRAEDELKHIRALAEDKGLLERHELQRKLDRLRGKLEARDKKLGEMERYVEHLKKNQRHELHERQGREEELKGQVASLEMENERLQNQLREKEKELEVRNIYSNRLIKPPGKLRHNLSPTGLKPVMLSKATSTDDQSKHPRPPPTERQQREWSAEEVRRREELTTRVKSPKDATPKTEHKVEPEKPKQKEPKSEEPSEEPNKELSEHEKILRDLDMGWGRRDGGEERQRQEEGRRRQLEEEERRKKEEVRQKELEERLRREEDERRRRRAEEEAAARKKLEEEEKPSVYKRPSFFGSKQDASSSQYKPSFLDSSPSTNSKLSFKRDDDSSSYKPSFFNTLTKPEHPQSNQNVTSATQNPQEMTPSSVSANPKAKSHILDDDDDFFETQPPSTNLPAWLRDSSNTTEVEREKKKKEVLEEASYSPDFDNSPNDNDSEENIPFFGSKPTGVQKPPVAKTPPYAVNSVRDLHRYSRGDNNSNIPKQGIDEGGQIDLNQANTADQEKEAERVAEERRKKDLLLAKMREIDDGRKPDSGRSHKSYNFTKPVENLHNGVPSHPEETGPAKGKKDDALLFGSYAPTFTSGKVAQKPKKKSFFDDDDDSDSDLFSKRKPATSPQGDKKSNLMADLFGNSASEEKVTKSSFGEDKNVFTSSTKAKPLSYPWEKKVDVVGGTNAASPGAANSSKDKGPSASKAVMNMSHDSLDDIDDIEEVVL